MPAAIALVLLLALGAGARSGWRTQADIAEEEERRRRAASGANGAPPPPVVQGEDDKWRYFYAYVVVRGQPAPRLFYQRGPMMLSDRAAFLEHMDLIATGQRHGQLVLVRRYDYFPGVGWRLAAPNSIGARPVPSSRGAVRGKWVFPGLPERVTLEGRVYERAKFSLPYPGVIAQYREAVAHDSRHLFVLTNGRFVVPHLDEANPDRGHMLEHAVRDVLPMLLPPGSPGARIRGV